jgi:hypothetical protein
LPAVDFAAAPRDRRVLGAQPKKAGPITHCARRRFDPATGDTFNGTCEPLALPQVRLAVLRYARRLDTLE